MENVDSKIMDKIRKLLSLGENNKNENEAQAAILKAHELMAEHGINAVATEDQNISYAKEFCEHRGNREFRKMLSSVIAANFRCKNYYHGAQVWLASGVHDSEQLEIQAESVAFIVSRYLGLDTSAFSFQHIAKYSLGRERNALEKFLDVIQKTALYFIDTMDGIRAARRIGYSNDDFFLFTNKKTAFRLFRQGHYLYLIYPKDGELLVMNKKQLEQYDGPFAVLRMDWFGATGKMAA